MIQVKYKFRCEIHGIMYALKRGEKKDIDDFLKTEERCPNCDLECTREFYEKHRSK